jgi:hypothetical protein
MDAIFTACDIAGLTTSVTSLVVGFVAVSLIFVARRYAGKAGIR